MLTPKQEKFCQNLAIKKMSQRKAYIDAYPSAAKWKPKTVDEEACRLVNENCKISARINELLNEEKENAQEEARWTREKAFQGLTWLIERAKSEAEQADELTSPVVSAMINAIKELNSIYAVGDKPEGKGVLEDILDAVRGLDND